MITRMISKSSFIRGTKCPKSLFLHFFQPEDRDEISENQQNIFNTGHSVGTYAQQLFPGGIDVSRGEHEKISEALTYTQELIAIGQKVIYEAAFSDGETLCYMDILANEDGKWRAYEVKASSGVKDYQVQDVAFQYYVITRSGLPLADIYLVHLNNQYIRRGEIDVQQLFTKVSMTARILPMQEEIPLQLKALQMTLDSGVVPEVSMGHQCTHLYPCDFLEFCRQVVTNVTNVTNMVPPTTVTTVTTITRHEFRNQPALDEFKAALSYPLFFLDFETINPAIPIHDESRPYQQIPFQFSLHVQENGKTVKRQNGKIEGDDLSDSLRHYSFLGTPPTDPRPAFIKELLDKLGSQGSIIVWNQGFEMNRLREIARDFPKYASRIEPLLDRFADLMVPFRRKHLYTPVMNGSYSLKAVLPALVPELSYGDLEIQEGGMASEVYLSLYFDTDIESISEKRENLLRYCGMDTLSMARILETL